MRRKIIRRAVYALCYARRVIQGQYCRQGSSVATIRAKCHFEPTFVLNSCPNKKIVGSLFSLTDTFLSLILDASCPFNPEQKINSNKTEINEYGICSIV